jgi:starch synthase (maltosyl-transferring)
VGAGGRQSPVTGLQSAAASTAPSPSEALARRVVIERVRPRIDEGRFAIKRTPGEPVVVFASIFADGHDVVRAVLLDRHVAGGEWRETPMNMVAEGTDEWSGRFTVDEIGWHEYAITAWVDRFRSWRHGLEIKSAAGQDVSIDLLEGSMLIRDAARRATGERAAWLLAQSDALTGGAPVDDRVAAALGEELAALMDRSADRSRATTSGPLRVWVDRDRARFSTWYEMFPRSTGSTPGKSGTFRDAAARLPDIADLGFDVVYLPPIHPIGRSFRKGPNNSLTCSPGDPGSPWAIGSADGGHTAIEPGLGTFADFEAFRHAAGRLGLEVALDLAWQCSPDHPWVREHPEWFRHRPDGTIKYAENPPKKYHDIYPFDFECDDWRGLWAALLDVTLFWIDRGVRIFRVDNPHTKTFGFWEWLIGEVHARDPHAIFLAEAFTRPALMRRLAKEGFSQSYTYFTWRNTKAELTEYLTELTTTEVQEYLRPNLFANTPDILHAYLQDGGRPAFEARLLLAATLGASYGIYSGFELCENRAVPGTEEYADSEKYQIRQWDWHRIGHIRELVARVNQIRREERALQFNGTLRFHPTDNDQIIAYTKSSPDGSTLILVVVNLDPHHMQHGLVEVPFDAGVLTPEQQFVAHDLIDHTEYWWRGGWNYVRFDPGVRQGHILKLETRN